MPRRRAKRPPGQDAPAPSARALVAAGTIRSPGERESLAVTLAIGEGQVHLHADAVELGAWPEEGVEITPIDATSFAFTAEGDRMIFRPADVITFTEDLGASSTVTTSPEDRSGAAPTSTTRRRRPARRTNRSAAPPRSTTTRGAVAPEPGDAGPSAPPPKDADPPKPKRKRPMPKISVSKVPLAKRTSPDPERPGRVEGPEGERRSLWLRSLDVARHQGWFSLDRVPVYEDRRGQDHDHTWNHRAVATSGLSRHVCTICGKVKLR